MKLISLLLSLALLAGCAGVAGPRSAGLDEGRLQRLEAAVQKDVAGGRIPGVVMAVARDGKVVMHKAVGQQDPSKPGAVSQSRLRGDDPVVTSA